MGDNQTNATLIHPEEHHRTQLVSYEVSAITEYAINTCLNTLISFVGIVSNVLTLIVFSKMGFKETANITMTTISFWNLIKCFCLGSYCIHHAMFIGPHYPALSYYFVTHYLGIHVSAMASYIAGFLSAYVAIERSLCVCLPFTVKHILSRRFVTINCIAISFCICGSYLVYIGNIRFITVQVDNFTSYIAVGGSAFYHSHPAVRVWLFTMGQIYPFTCVGITSICTVIITYKLKKASEFRSGGKDASNQLSARDTKIIRMLLVVVVVYLGCSLPWVVSYLAQMAYPAFSTKEEYYLHWLVYNIVHTFSLVDGSVNILIFYNMSSEFHRTLRHLLCRAPLKDK